MNEKQDIILREEINRQIKMEQRLSPKSTEIILTVPKNISEDELSILLQSILGYTPKILYLQKNQYRIFRNKYVNCKTIVVKIKSDIEV